MGFPLLPALRRSILPVSALLAPVGLLGLLTGCGPGGPSIDQGRALYAANGCASCHGREGHGDGPLAPTLDTHPTDFRSAALFTGGTDPASIAKTLAQGISSGPATASLHASHHELLMPKFDHLTEPERTAIALYVISLRKEAAQP